MKKIYLVLVFFNVFHLAFGQSDVVASFFDPDSKVGIGNVVVDKGDNIIMSGYYMKSSASSTANLRLGNNTINSKNEVKGQFCVKMNKQKEIIWSKLIEGTENYISALSRSFNYALVDDSSNVYLVGKFRGKLVFDDKNILEAPTGDVFVVKYSSAGQLKWAKKYVGSSDNLIYSPKIDNKGNIYIIGAFKTALEVAGKVVLKATGLDAEPYLLKLDRNGNYVLAKTFSPNIEVSAVSVNAQSEIFLAGNFEGNIALSENVKIQSVGMKDVFYAKLDANAQILWAKTIGGVLRDDTHNMEVDNFGNIYVAGVVSNSAKYDSLVVNIQSERGVNVFLSKIDGNKGKVLWVKNMTYGDDLYTSFNYHETVKFLKLNDAGEPYIFGNVNDFIRINANLELREWGYIVVAYLIKFNKVGDLVFAQQTNAYQVGSISLWNSIAFDSKKNTYFSGNTSYKSSNVNGFLKTKIELDDSSCSSTNINIARSYNFVDKTEIVALSDAILDNKIFNYQWYKNGEAIPDATQPTFPAKDVGYYSLKLTNKTNNFCQVNSSNTVNILPVALFTPANLYFGSRGSYRYLYTDYPVGDKIEWYRNNSIIDVSNDTETPFAGDGTYKIKKYFANNTIVKESNEVTIKGLLGVGITKTVFYDDGDFCKPVPFLKIDVGGNPINTKVGIDKIEWFLDGAIIKDSTDVHLKILRPGEYQVRIVVNNTAWDFISGKYKIVIEDFPKSLSINKIEDNCGAKATLKVDDSFMKRYTFQSIVWRLEGKDIPNENYPFLNVNKGGYYTFSVKYIGDNSAACNYNSFVTFDKKTDFKLNVAYAYAGSACVVDSFKVFVPYDKNYSYAWTKNDVPIKSQTANELFVKDKSRYKAIVRRADGCINETDEISLKGCTSASSDKFILLNPPTITAEKTSFYANEKSLLSSETCTNANMQWLKDAQPIVGASQKTLEVKEAGNYTLQIEKFGCVASTNALKISVENVLSVGEELPEIEIEVYPNPTEDNLIVSTSSQINSPITAKMINNLGKLIKNIDILQTRSQIIDIKTLPEGMYFLVFEVNGKRIVKKIIKKD